MFFFAKSVGQGEWPVKLDEPPPPPLYIMYMRIYFFTLYMQSCDRQLLFWVNQQGRLTYWNKKVIMVATLLPPAASDPFSYLLLN